MDINRREAITKIVNAIGQERGSAARGDSLGSVIFPRVLAANAFTRFTAHEKHRDASTAAFPEHIRNRCWFAVSIHALAADDLLFQMSQEMVLLGVSDELAQARMKKSDMWPTLAEKEVKAGVAIAWLMQIAQCHDLINAPADPEHDLFIETLALFTGPEPDTLMSHADKAGVVQDLPLPYMRVLLLAACAVIDPASAVLRECTRPDGDAFESMRLIPLGGVVPLDTQLSGVKEARVLEVINEISAPLPVYIAGGKNPTVPVPIYFDVKRVQVGNTLYRASHAIRHSDNHYTFMWYDTDPRSDPVIVDSHGGKPPNDVPTYAPGSSHYTVETKKGSLFLVRL